MRRPRKVSSGEGAPCIGATVLGGPLGEGGAGPRVCRSDGAIGAKRCRRRKRSEPAPHPPIPTGQARGLAAYVAMGPSLAPQAGRGRSYAPSPRKRGEGRGEGQPAVRPTKQGTKKPP